MMSRIERDFLSKVRRPSRYIGGEVNQIKKDLDSCDLTVALCFPDVYDVGMSHTGLAILYDILNSMGSVAAERVFAPWSDAEQILRQTGIPLFSLESRQPLGDFDIIGFSLSNELCYSNVLNMLDLAGLKLRTSQRSDSDPLIIAGGTMANCCEPVAEFIDLFVIGEAEQAAQDIANLYIDRKKYSNTKSKFLETAAKQFDWAYIPSIHDKTSKRINAVVEDFDNAPFPLKPIVPFAEPVHERVCVEIMRGCPGRCRFCQASYCRRPVRSRTVSRIVEIAKAAQKATGFDTVSLLSLSTADYPQLEELIGSLNRCFDNKHVGISVPSLRVDSQLKLLPKLVTSVRKSGLTIAVEAASEKIRQIINKPLKDADLFAAVEAAYQAGYQKLKLYFMCGLPGETEKDVERIVDLANDLARLRKKVDGRTANINVAISWFVPKAHTPFAWVGQQSIEYFQNCKQLILDRKKQLRVKYLQFKFHNIQCSILESAIGRGDRNLGDVIESAWRAGARFDLWNECFDFEIWQRAFADCGYDVEQLAAKEFSKDDILPWAHLGGPDKDYLLKHLTDAQSINR